jgi:hypothetical protein
VEKTLEPLVLQERILWIRFGRKLFR